MKDPAPSSHLDQSLPDIDICYTEEDQYDYVDITRFCRGPQDRGINRPPSIMAPIPHPAQIPEGNTLETCS